MARTKIQSPQLNTTVSTDANGWRVTDFGSFKEYYKVIRNSAYGVGAGDADYSIGADYPVGVTQAMMPTPDLVEIFVRENWTTVNWNMLMRAFGGTTFNATQIVISFHVYVDSARSITVAFGVKFRI